MQNKEKVGKKNNVIQIMYALREARMIYENALQNKYTLAQATNEVDATLQLAYY